MENQFQLEPLPEKELPRIYRVAVGAVGGQGGGAISEIIFYAVKYERERNAPIKAKKHTYETRGMIPGLAQRSGSTITSVTFVDPTLTDDELPDQIILTEMPHRGSCDLVIGQELNELMKFLPLVKEGGLALVNEERHIMPPEKLPGFIPKFTEEDQLQAAKSYMKKGSYIGFKGKNIIRQHSLDPRMINTFMLGIISASNALPISKESYIMALERRFSGKVFEKNKEAFLLGEQFYLEGRYKDSENAVGWDDLTIDELIERSVNTATAFKRWGKKKAANRIRSRLQELVQHFPEPANRYIVEAYGQLTDFQNEKHAERYISLLSDLWQLNNTKQHPEILEEYSRNLAGRLMQWDGPVRVAEYAIRDHLNPIDSEGRVYIMEKKLQPTVEEIIGMVPVPKFLYGKTPRFLYSIYQRNMFRGFRLNTRPTGFFGFMTFWFLSKLKRFRPWMIRFHREMNLISFVHENQMKWTNRSAVVGYAHAHYLGKIRGYSYVRHRHLTAYRRMVESLDSIFETVGEERTAHFIDHLYREVSNAGQNLEQIDELADRYKGGDFQVSLTPLLED
ncbi:MAG: hypothetical protein D6732_05620 [Methanobacteriota archaeon]|nr:MAG: hypothetical protein D6732_05620 [Euryarchaeota archaeon]